MFDIEEGLEDCLVPKLLLQPLIENAIMHGIGDREQGERYTLRWRDLRKKCC